MTRLVVVLGVVAVATVVLVAELVRQRKLKERHAAIWFVFSLAVAFGVLFPESVNALARFLGFELPANLVLLVGVVTLAFLSLQLSVELGRVRDHVERLTTEVALLEVAAEAIGQRDGEPDAGSEEPSS